MAEKVTIRRYSNRKLYMTTEIGGLGPSYVTLQQVAALLRAGHELEAREYDGGADITAEVLANIIVWEMKKGTRAHPVEGLLALVRAAA